MKASWIRVLSALYQGGNVWYPRGRQRAWIVTKSEGRVPEVLKSTLCEIDDAGLITLEEQTGGDVQAELTPKGWAAIDSILNPSQTTRMDVNFADPDCLELLAKHAEQESARLNGWVRELGKSADPGFVKSAARMDRVAANLKAVAAFFRNEEPADDQFTGLDLFEEHQRDLNESFKAGEVDGIVDENEGGIIAYVLSGHTKRVLNILNGRG